jgi:hypothetical protein
MAASLRVKQAQNGSLSVKGILAGCQNVDTQGTADDAPPTFAVYDGQRCIGHLVNRNRSNVQSVDANDRSFGVFATAQAAADAISNTNTSPKNENPDAAQRRRHRGNSVCPKEVPNGRPQYPRPRRPAQ